MAMQTSKLGKNFIKAHEGKVLRAYKDTTGTVTIGYGITSEAGLGPITLGMKITSQQADEMFDKALTAYEARCEQKLGMHGREQNIFDGAVSFDWNTGKITSATWVTYLREGDYTRAEMSLKSWVKSKGTKLPGLVRRRQEEADIIFRGVYPNNITGIVAKHKPIQQDEILEAQSILAEKGLYADALDGILGPKTKAAILAYQQLHPHLTNDGVLGPATLAQLRRDYKLLRSAAASAAVPGTIFGTAVELFTENSGLAVALGGVVVAMVFALYLYRNWDIIKVRINKLLNRSVE